MQRSLIAFAATLCVILGAVTSTLAGPLAPEHLPADTKWFGHVNAEAIRDVPIVQRMMGKVEAKHGDRLDAMTLKIGTNPMTVLNGATLMANQYEGEVGSLLLYVNGLDQKKMLAMFKEKHPDHKAEKFGKRTLYTWQMKHRHHKWGKAKWVTGTFANKRLIVLGSSPETVKATLAVIDGDAPSIAVNSPLLEGVRDEALFVSKATTVPADYQKATKCPVLRYGKAASAQWTLVKNKIEGRYELVANSPQQANMIKAILEGGRALAQLKIGQHDLKQAGKLLSQVKIRTKKDVLKVDVNTTVDAVKAAAEELHAKKHEMMKAYGHHHRHGHKHHDHKAKCCGSCGSKAKAACTKCTAAKKCGKCATKAKCCGACGGKAKAACTKCAAAKKCGKCATKAKCCDACGGKAKAACKTAPTTQPSGACANNDACANGGACLCKPAK